MHIDLFTYWPKTMENQVLLGHFSKDLSKNRASVTVLDGANLGFVYPEYDH